MRRMAFLIVLIIFWSSLYQASGETIEDIITNNELVNVEEINDIYKVKIIQIVRDSQGTLVSVTSNVYSGIIPTETLEKSLDRIYENTDSKFIQGEPDIYWIQKGGQDPIMWCKKLEQRMPLLHLKDFIMINDQESFFAEIGLGNLDIKNIVKKATDSGCKWFIVEQDECRGDPFDSLRISYNNLIKYAVT